MVEAIRRAGIESPVFGGDSLDSPELRREGMGMIVFSTHALLDENSSRTGEFARAYRAEYGHLPENAFSALGYDTVNLLAEAIDRAGSGDPQAILEALEEYLRIRGSNRSDKLPEWGRIPNKDVTMILQTDGEITGSEIVTPPVCQPARPEEQTTKPQ